MKGCNVSSPSGVSSPKRCDVPSKVVKSSSKGPTSSQKCGMTSLKWWGWPQ